MNPTLFKDPEIRRLMNKTTLLMNQFIQMFSKEYGGVKMHKVSQKTVENFKLLTDHNKKIMHTILVKCRTIQQIRDTFNGQIWQLENINREFLETHEITDEMIIKYTAMNDSELKKNRASTASFDILKKLFLDGYKDFSSKFPIKHIPTKYQFQICFSLLKFDTLDTEIILNNFSDCAENEFLRIILIILSTMVILKNFSFGLETGDFERKMFKSMQLKQEEKSKLDLEDFSKETKDSVEFEDLKEEMINIQRDFEKKLTEKLKIFENKKAMGDYNILTAFFVALNIFPEEFTSNICLPYFMRPKKIYNDSEMFYQLDMEFLKMIFFNNKIPPHPDFVGDKMKMAEFLSTNEIYIMDDALAQQLNRMAWEKYKQFDNNNAIGLAERALILGIEALTYYPKFSVYQKAIWDTYACALFQKFQNEGDKILIIQAHISFLLAKKGIGGLTKNVMNTVERQFNKFKGNSNELIELWSCKFCNSPLKKEIVLNQIKPAKCFFCKRV